MQQTDTVQRIKTSAILKEAFRLYTTRWKDFYSSYLILYIPMFVLMIPMFLLGVFMPTYSVSMQSTTQIFSGVFMALAMVAFVGIYVVYLVVAPPIAIAQYRIMLDPKSKGLQTIGQSFKKYGRSMGSCYLSMLLQSLVSGASSSIITLPVLLGSIIPLIVFSILRSSIGIAISMVYVFGIMFLLYGAFICLILLINALLSLFLPTIAHQDMPIIATLRYSIKKVGPALLSGMGAYALNALVNLIILAPINILSFARAFYLASPYASSSLINIFTVVFYLVFFILQIIILPFATAIPCAMYNLTHPIEGDDSL